MKEEFNLSEKIEIAKEFELGNGIIKSKREVIESFHVKEFVRRLKKRFSDKDMPKYNGFIIREEIDKLAGDKLK